MSQKERKIIRAALAAATITFFIWAIPTAVISASEIHAERTQYESDCYLIVDEYEKHKVEIDIGGDTISRYTFAMTCKTHMLENPNATGRDILEIFKDAEQSRTVDDWLDKPLMP